MALRRLSHRPHTIARIHWSRAAISPKNGERLLRRQFWGECPLRHFYRLKPPFRNREEFRMPFGVRKSPRNERAGLMWRSMGL